MTSTLQQFYDLLNGDTNHSVASFMSLYSLLNIVKNPPVFCSDQYDIVNNKWYDKKNVYFRDETQCAKWCLFSDILNLAPREMRNKAFSELIFRNMKDKRVLCFCANDNNVLSDNLSCEIFTIINVIQARNIGFQEITGLCVESLVKKYEAFVQNTGFKQFSSRNDLITDNGILSFNEKQRIEQFLSSGDFQSYKLSNQLYGIAESADEEHNALLCVALFFCLFKDIQYYVFVPASGIRSNCEVDVENSSGGSFFWVDSKSQINISSFKLILACYIETIRGLYRSAVDWNRKQTRVIKSHATKSAIGSIMSRNGSHNIGSHVLAALSHNVGTMPDDRVLYQYIQHRMDYIATATTEFPRWKMPTMFLGNMMKVLLSQRHLLDNIAGSENLKAWKFQRREVDEEERSVARIKFIIRRIGEDGEPSKVLLYDGNGGTVNLDHDVSLAIPGGTIGQHAFFTIVENVIRNSAKHDWSSPSARIIENGIKKLDANGDVVKGNLEVYIDFKDLPEEGNVEFKVFTNMSDADEPSEGLAGQTIFEKVSDALKAKFIDETGGLRKAKWGIAEMKISAGYLQSRESGVIGGLDSTSEKAKADKKHFGPEIIEPVRVTLAEEKYTINHLGYRFKVPKPRTLLIIVDDLPEELRSDEERSKDLATLGIYVKTKEEVGAARADNSFEFVLMDSFSEDQLRWSLPFRIICTNRSESGCHVRDLVAIWDKKEESAFTIATELAKCRKFALKRSVFEVLFRVSECWMAYLKKRRGIEGKFNLIIDVEAKKPGGYESGHGLSGQSLVNEAAAVAFVFEEGFEKVVNSFESLYKDDYMELKSLLELLKEKARNVGASVKRSDGSFRELIKIQIARLVEDCSVSVGDEVVSFLKLEPKNSCCPIKRFVDYLEQACEQAKGYLGQYAEKISTLPEHFITNCQAEEEAIPAAKISQPVVDCKYVDPCDEKDKTPNIKYKRHFIPKNATFRTEEEIKRCEPPEFVCKPFENLGQEPNLLYIEPLSGTQSYFTQIQAQRNNQNNIFKAKLVESALTRILIVDERVSKFIVSHSDSTLATFARMCISIVDDKIVTDALEKERCAAANQVHPDEVRLPERQSVNFSANGLVKFDVEGIRALRDIIMFERNGQSQNTIFRVRRLAAKLCRLYKPFKDKFDIIVVHLGILDKWFPGIVNDEHKMAILYDSFKRVFPYVVITTGRGMPANIPDMARVLPFSTIETTLFRKYPEKLVLVDAIMNILPHTKTKGNGVL